MSTETIPLGDALKLAVWIVQNRRDAMFFEGLGMHSEVLAMDDPNDDDDSHQSQPLHLEPQTQPVESSVLFGLPVKGRVTSRFGIRKHPISGIWKTHKGVDVAAPIGTPVYATGAGTVTFAGWRGGYGKCVVIDHGNGTDTLYAHMNAIHVLRSQLVAGGDLIGDVGTTGNSTGPHCHYEMRRDGTAIDPLG